MEEEAKNIIIETYYKYFSDFLEIAEIEHIPNELFAELQLKKLWQGQPLDHIIITLNTLSISYDFFDVAYPLCKEIIIENKDKNEGPENINLLLAVCTRILLCLNGEIPMCFAVRRELFAKKFLNNFVDEINMINAICKKFTKSSIPGKYKEGIISLWINSEFENQKEKAKIEDIKNENIIIKIYQMENQYLNEYFKRHDRKYCAGGFRLSLCNFLGKFNPDILNWEYNEMKNFISKNVHNSSATHYLLVLIKKKLKQSDYSINVDIKGVTELLEKFSIFYSQGDISYASEIDYTKLSCLKNLKKELSNLKV